jgi:hypothetical protein
MIKNLLLTSKVPKLNTDFLKKHKSTIDIELPTNKTMLKRDILREYISKNLCIDNKSPI